MKSTFYKTVKVLIFVFCFFSIHTHAVVITSSVTGNWNAGSTWLLGVVPAAGQDAIIATGTTVHLTANASITNVTVTGTGVLDLNTNATALTVSGNFVMNGSGSINGNVSTRVITVAGNFSVTSLANVIVQDIGLTVTGTAQIDGTLTLNTGATAAKSFGNLTITGTLTNSASNQPLTVVGNMTNNGTFTSGTGRVTFTGPAATSNTISGTAALTSFGGGITINKGAKTDVLEVTCVISLTPVNAATELVPTRGMFKISSASTFTPFFANKNGASPYDVGPNATLWLNNAGATLNSRSGGGGNTGSWSIEGMLRLTAGTINVGVLTDDWLAPRAGSTIEVQGGNLNVAGRISQAGSVWSFSMTGGNITVPTVASATTARPPFNMDLTTQVFNMSGGTIIIQQAGGTAGPDNSGFFCKSTTGGGMTGGTIQIGNASTPAGNIMEIESTNAVYNVNVNDNNATARISFNNLTVTKNLTITDGIFDMNGLDMTVGGNWTNSSSIADPYLEGVRTVTFNGTAAQTISNTGTALGTTFYKVMFNNSFGTSPQITLAANMAVTNTFSMTLGVTDLAGFRMTLGTTGANPGTLVCTPANTNFLSGGNFSRWFGTGTVANASAAGLFPMGNTTGVDYYASMYVTCPTAGPTTGGSITVTYTDPFTVSAVSFADNPTATLIVKRHDEIWGISTGSLAAGAATTYSLRADRTFTAGYVGATSDLRLTLLGSTVGSSVASGGTVLIPQVSRQGLTVANLTNNWYIGSIDATNSPLPIELLSFEAALNKNYKVDVDWATATEKNCDYFIVQKSTDGINFTDVGKMDGAGNSLVTKNYSLIDDNPTRGISYYRLKQIDFDKTETYSPLKVVNYSGLNSSFAVYPNPFSNVINLAFQGTSPGQITITVKDLTGKTVFNEDVFIKNDNEILNIDLTPFAKGFYFLSATDSSQTINQKIIKQ